MLLNPHCCAADAAEDVREQSFPGQCRAMLCPGRHQAGADHSEENEMGTLLLVTVTLVHSLKPENLIFGPVVFGYDELFLLDSYAHSVVAAVV